MEKGQFYNCYTLFFKTTPKADIIGARIEKAKNLLTNQELKVHQVSEMCGFKNVCHFSRCFKKRTNFSPCEYVERGQRHENNF
jgi:transcriptional regulator GlxA family with amidase domain